MKVFKAIIVGLVLIVVGMALTSPWILINYVILLIAPAIIVVFSIIYSITKKTNEWRKPTLYFVASCVPVVSSFCFTGYLQSHQIEKQNRLIAAIYDYRQTNGRFPRALKDLKTSIDTIRANYIPAETLQDFDLYLKGFYGFPQHFSAKDSARRLR